MIKFPSIGQFRNVIQAVNHSTRYRGTDENGKAIIDNSPDVKNPVIKYKGYVKLHGTNAAIVYDSATDETIFQSRERVLSLDEDNAGFYAYMKKHSDSVTELMNKIRERFYSLDLTVPSVFTYTQAVYGEWCGGSIQKGVALAELPKMFVIFKIQINGSWMNIEDFKDIQLPDVNIFNIANFPSYEVDIDFNVPTLAQNKLIEITEAVEAECPVAKHFGVSGVGEGVVWTPDVPVNSVYNTSGLWMKVKGEKHSVSKVKTLATVDVQAVKALQDFIEYAVTEQRLEQGLQHLINEQLKPFDRTSTGDFVRWVYTDVIKEESDTIIASGFDVNKLGGPIGKKASSWYLAKLNAV